ncbi:MAG: hypothetical protein AB8B93_15565 [Pseudomonadales bacterium]
MTDSNTPPLRSPEQVRRRNRLQLIAIFMIAVISLSASYFLFFSARDGGVWGTTNNGEWVKPPLVAADLGLLDASGAAAELEPLWGVWVVSDQPCAQVCDEAVFKMRQLHVLLNKDADRVRRALIAPDAAGAQLRENYPKLSRWTAAAQALAPGVYLVDPIGNLVFRYPLDTVGKPVLSDLKRLLKVSQIG